MDPGRRRAAPALLPVLLVLVAVAPASSQERPRDSTAPGTPPVTVELPPIEVLGATPLPALGLPLEKYPGNVQSVTPGDRATEHLVDLSDMLHRSLGPINVNAGQSNPWQHDVTYRGFLASPLTGSAIGLSVYLDGMRFNDGFGDTVHWDLIPRAAMAGVDVIPGSNPIFGLNTLGGALSVRTKSGNDFPGSRIGASGGSFGRWAVEAEHGGHQGPVDWYVTFNALDEDGWRAHSPSELRQVFGKLGWEAGDTRLSVSYAHANNDLVGNGLVPESTRARDRRAVHTFPDRTRNEMHLVNLGANHWLTGTVLLSANAFYRDYRRRTLNGDAEVVCVDDASARQVFDANGRPRHLGLCRGSSSGLFDEDGNPLAGVLERDAEGEVRTTTTATRDWGATLQLSHKGRVVGRANRLTLGAAYDDHESRFAQREAEADLVPRRDGIGTRRTGEFETEADVRTRQQNVGVYVSNTFDLTERLALTFAGRYQHVSIQIRDRSGENPAVNGDHSFHRFSPAAGITFQVLPRLTGFASYSEGFRAPTPAELTCADPNAPCNLPNAFLADPPLDPVVARTYEIGVRGTFPVGRRLGWSLALFRTDVQDDILFTVVETGGGGFFRNVGRTRRQGVEAGLAGAWKRLEYSVSYAYVDATYETDVILASVTEPGGERVRAGDRIPGVPQHNLKVGADLEVAKSLWLGANVVATSGSFLRGDDGNDRAKTDGYAILNLHARYEPIKHVQLWSRIDNVTDADYETGGAINFNAFATPVAVERFVAPGTPRAVWAGVTVRF